MYKLVLIYAFFFMSVVLAQKGNTNMLGDYEQRVINLTVIPTLDDNSNTFLYKKRISFSKLFQDEPQVLLTIQSIVLIHGSVNSYQTQVQSISTDGFDIVVQCYEKESEFNFIFLYTAFQKSDYIKVYYLFSQPTPSLHDYESYSRQKAQNQVIGSIQLNGHFSANLINTSTFILGVKSSEQNQDVSIKTFTQLQENGNKLDVFASCWNNVKIQSVSVAILIWNVPNSFVGELKGNQYDSQYNTYKSHPWINTRQDNRYATISCDTNVDGDTALQLFSIYGLRGYDIREGPIVIIEKDINFDFKNNQASSSVGTTGRTKLVGIWISAVILRDVDKNYLQEQMSPLVLCLIVAGSLVGVFIIFSIFYLKFFGQNQDFKHKKFSNKDFSQSGSDLNGNSQSIQGHSVNQQGVNNQNNSKDVVTLEFPQKFKQIQRKKNTAVLLSRDLLTGVKQSEKNPKIYNEKTVIVEMSEECTKKNVFSEHYNSQNFQSALEKQESNAKPQLQKLEEEEINDSPQYEKNQDNQIFFNKQQQKEDNRDSLSEIQSTLENEHGQETTNRCQPKILSDQDLIQKDKSRSESITIEINA
ncbi:H-type lectin domain protein (macronuclear) [Tetrahymena thermophila SB210]|uniref:H-type lectin domain protein n=1 Tax=Tetrahymena thermophila (strain SB210) TaxID=312017 RepID=Q23U23_TETTS|nr:H-type lectin domain protein [Tetrahymena thermophila SB210]EAS00027.4 H-type lectin domain protein [Tetrahymena thermophila SB210]|eukprot:XP_001020272.4 H-type lectin domain protein [Tetrahymena thermophila SB210]